MRASSEEQPPEALSRRGSEQVVGFAARAEEDCVPGLGKVVGRGYRIIQVGAADDQRPAVLEGVRQQRAGGPEQEDGVCMASNCFAPPIQGLAAVLATGDEDHAI